MSGRDRGMQVTFWGSRGSSPVVMSHAGLPADRPLLAGLPERTLFLGGHNHVTVEHRQGTSRYVHTGAWGQPLTVATIDRARKADPIRISRVVVDPRGPADPVLARQVEDALAANLTPEERAVVAKVPKASEPRTQGYPQKQETHSQSKTRK